MGDETEKKLLTCNRGSDYKIKPTVTHPSETITGGSVTAVIENHDDSGGQDMTPAFSWIDEPNGKFQLLVSKLQTPFLKYNQKTFITITLVYASGATEVLDPLYFDVD